MPEFTHRDPSQPAVRDERFAAGVTPWEASGVPPAFLRWLDEDGPRDGARVLVPGRGGRITVAGVATRPVWRGGGEALSSPAFTRKPRAPVPSSAP